MATTHIPVWTLGDRLRKAREDAGLSQTELAEAIGVSRNTISNHEVGEGKRGPQMLLLRAWAQATGTPVEWLQTGHVQTPQPMPRRGQARKRSDTELMQLRYPGHTPNDRHLPVPA